MNTKKIGVAESASQKRDTLSEAAIADMLAYASVLIELGWLHDAEYQIAKVLDEEPGNLSALSLLAKVKHIRGELSQAIACWAQLYTQSAQSRRSSTHLAALLHLADDPERSAAEFIALTTQPQAMKPTGALGLEEVFHLFSAKRYDEAHQRAAEIAAKYRREDLATYKLAILANAWISELSGDLDRACETLEAMGIERGFETDEDRLLALARIYELRNSERDLQRALKIYSYLEGATESELSSCSSLLSNLAALHERLGNEVLAKSYALRYLAAYRRRMHRPSFEDTIRVSGSRYVGLCQLSTLRFWSSKISGPLSERERALVDALSTRLEEARATLQQGTDVLDKKYLADVARLEGKDALAFDLYLETLEDDHFDLQIVGYLLESNAVSEQVSIASYFRDPWTFSQIRRALEEALRAAPLRPSLWAQLASLHSNIGDSREADSCHHRAGELAAAAKKKSKPVGRALSASVYHFIGQAHGLIHEVWTHREPVAPGMGGVLAGDQILGNVTAQMKDGIRNTFFAVREYARTKFPRRTADLFNFNYTFKVPKEDERSGGLSAGLPAALAFLSVFLQKPIPQTLASSGILVADAHDVLTIRRIGDAEHKVNAAYHRNLESLILPRENAGELFANARVPREVCSELVYFVSSFDEAVKIVFGEDIFVQP